MLSNIKTLIFLMMIGVFIAGCADVPSDAPVFPDFKSEMRILNATRTSPLLMQPTGADPSIAIYNTVVTVDRDTTIDTTIVTTVDTVWNVPSLDTTITPADTTIDTDVTPPDTTITPADTSIVQPDSSIIEIDFTHDSTFTTTFDSLVTTEEFAIRQTFFKDLSVNTGNLSVSVDGTSIGAALAYEDLTGYVQYPSGVYNITFTATTSLTATITVTDSVTLTNGEAGAGSGADTVSVPASGVDGTLAVSDNVTLVADARSMVILHDDNGGDRVSNFHEKYMAEVNTGTNNGLVRVINTYSAGSALTVSYTDSITVDGVTVLPNLAVGLGFMARAGDDPADTTLVDNFYSGYAEVPVGTSITVTDGSSSATDVLIVTSGKRQSLIIFGTSSGFKISQILDN